MKLKCYTISSVVFLIQVDSDRQVISSKQEHFVLARPCHQPGERQEWKPRLDQLPIVSRFDNEQTIDIQIGPGTADNLAYRLQPIFACGQRELRFVPEFGRQLRASFEAQVSLFPQMTNDSVNDTNRRYAGKALGWKLSGAGGGGYLVLVSRQPVPGAIRIKIRRP